VQKAWAENRCVIQDVCGGCPGLRVPEEHAFLSKVAGFSRSIGSAANVEPFPASERYGYRSRVYLRVRLNEAGQLTTGYFNSGSRQFVPASGCPVADAPINLFLGKLNEHAFGAGRAVRFRLQLQSIEGGFILAAVTCYAEDLPVIRPVVTAMASFPMTAWAGFVAEAADAPMFLSERGLGFDYLAKPGMFLQANRAMNQVLRGTVGDIVAAARVYEVTDLYSGNGNLSLGLDSAVHVTGVEVEGAAVQCARETVRRARMPNKRYIPQRVESYLKGLRPGPGTRLGLVIADPPRAGLGAAAEDIGRLGFGSMIYVSCNPASFVSDLKTLGRYGYELSRLMAFEFFPHTGHLEVVGVLTNRSAP